MPHLVCRLFGGRVEVNSTAVLAVARSLRAYAGRGIGAVARGAKREDLAKVGVEGGALGKHFSDELDRIEA